MIEVVENEKKLERNIKWYKYYIIFSGALFIWPIEVLFFKQCGMGYSYIMLIESLISIISLIFEIPSGIIADKIGCKKTVLFGIASQIFAFIILISMSSFVGACIYAFFVALGYAMVSGADTALLYESHKLLNKEKEYGNTIRNAGSMKMFSLAFVTLSSGLLFRINSKLPYILSIIFLIIAFCVVNAYKEIRIKKEETDTSLLKENIEMLKENFINNRKICWILLISLLFSFMFADINYFMQAYMEKIDIKVAYYGIVFFVCNMISAISFKNGGKLKEKLKNNTCVIMCILMTVIMFFAGCAGNVLGVIAMCFVRVGVATVSPILNVELNRNIESNSRATVLSIYNAIVCVFMAIFDILIGIIMDKIGIFNVCFIIGVIGVVLAYILFYSKKKRLIE